MKRIICVKSWMHVEQEQLDVILSLDGLAQEGRISWRVYITIGKGTTGIAMHMLDTLLRKAGFVNIQEEPTQHILCYMDPATGRIGELWFFTQDDLCEFDHSPDSARFANTNHARSMHSPDVVAKINSINNRSVVNRTLIVVGNAKKATLIHDICLLVPDYDSCAVWRSVDCAFIG